MPGSPRASLIAKLPKPAADLAERAKKKNDADLFKQLLEAVGFPQGDGVLLEELTPPQRAAAILVADIDAGLQPFALPRMSGARRRWLGLDPARALDTVVTYAKQRQPLWRALQLAEPEGEKALVKAFATVPLATRAAAVMDIFYDAFAYGFEPSTFVASSRVLEDIRGAKLVAWARDEADRMVGLATERKKNGWFRYPVESHCWPVFVALARGKVTIEPRWEPLLPVGTKKGVPGATMKECLLAIPESRRVPALIAALNDCLVDGGIRPALELLGDSPFPELVKWLIDRDSTLANKELKALAKKKPAVAAALKAATKGQAPPVALTVLSLLKPKRLADLDTSAQAQLRAAGKAWDGKNLSAEARIANDNSETSLRGTIELRAIGDATGKHVYDALTHSGDSGAVYIAGTTKRVAAVVQGGVECKDAALAAGLREALTRKPGKR